MKKKLDLAVDFFMAMLIIGMTIVVTISVFFRYVLNLPLSWTEEITRLMLVWLSFVGAYMAMREDRHIGFDLLTNYFPSKLKKAVALIGQLLITVFLLVVILQGLKFSREFLTITMPYTNIPIGWFYYSVLPIGGALMLMQTILKSIEITHSFGDSKE